MSTSNPFPLAPSCNSPPCRYEVGGQHRLRRTPWWRACVQLCWVWDAFNPKLGTIYVELLIFLRFCSVRASSKVLLFPCTLKCSCKIKPSTKNSNTQTQKKEGKNNRCALPTSSVSFLITTASTPSFGGEACEAPIVHKHRGNALK